MFEKNRIELGYKRTMSKNGWREIEEYVKGLLEKYKTYQNICTHTGLQYCHKCLCFSCCDNINPLNPAYNVQESDYENSSK